MNLKKTIKNNKTLIISILIAFFIEIFICNFPFFRTLFQENNNIIKEYSINNSEITIDDINERIDNWLELVEENLKTKKQINDIKNKWRIRYES